MREYVAIAGFDVQNSFVVFSIVGEAIGEWLIAFLLFANVGDFALVREEFCNVVGDCAD